MADFPSNPLPDYPIEITAAAPEVLISTHRDGSEQRRLKGAGRKRIFRLSFGSSMPITNTQRLALVNHYAGQDGSTTSFTWTNVETAEAITCRYAEPPNFRHSGYNSYEGSVTLQEVPA